MITQEQALQKAREIDPMLPPVAPHLNGEGKYLVALASRLRELEEQAIGWISIDLTDPKMDATAEFAIVSVEAEFHEDTSVVVITGVHGDTGLQEAIRVPIKNPTPTVMRDLKKLEGHRLSKTTRQLMPKRSGISARIVMVTPYECLMMLKGNAQQRPLQMSLVQRYVQAHSDGKWLVCNQGMGIDWVQALIDGQHRAFAVLLTGQAMPILLVWGLDPHARGVVDQGGGRTPGQVDDMMGRSEGLPSGVATQKFTNKIYLAHGGTTNKSRLYYLSIKNHYLGSLEWLYLYTHPVEPRYPYAKKLLTSAAVVSAFLMMHRAFPGEAERFAELVLAPVPNTANPMIIMVREYLVDRSRKDQPASKHDYLDQMYRLLTGFLMWKNGQNRSSLKSLPVRKSTKRPGTLTTQRRAAFYKMLQVLWNEEPLLPDDALKTVGWAPANVAG